MIVLFLFPRITLLCQMYYSFCFRLCLITINTIIEKSNIFLNNSSKNLFHGLIYILNDPRYFTDTNIEHFSTPD